MAALGADLGVLRTIRRHLLRWRSVLTMTKERGHLRLVGQGITEILFFVVILWSVLWALQHTALPNSGWRGLVVLVVVFVGAGAVPFPWTRHAVMVAVAGFFAAFSIFGWLSWAFSMMPMVPSWRDLPGVLLSGETLGVAALASVAALVGRMLAGSVGRRTTR